MAFFRMELAHRSNVVAPYRRIELDAVMGFHERVRWVIDMHTIGVDEVIAWLTIYLCGQSARICSVAPDSNPCAAH